MTSNLECLIPKDWIRKTGSCRIFVITVNLTHYEEDNYFINYITFICRSFGIEFL